VLFANAASDSSAIRIPRRCAGDYRLFAFGQHITTHQNAGFVGKFETKAHSVHVVQVER
jgi:hypothetical protein